MSDAGRIDLGVLIGPDRVFAGVRALDKQKLLAELGKRAAAALGLGVADVIASLAAREALGSTGIGAGIAVPHARLEGLGDMVGFFARLQQPIEFNAIDGKKVDLVFLLLSPARGPAAHLAALAAIARRLRDPEAAAAIRAAGSEAQIRDILLGSARQ